MGAAIVAVLRMKEKAVVQLFLDRRATSATSARSLSELQLDENTTIRRLRRREIIREASPGLYFLDQPNWVAVRRSGQRAAVLVMVVLLVAAFGAWAAVRTGAALP